MSNLLGKAPGFWSLKNNENLKHYAHTHYAFKIHDAEGFLHQSEFSITTFELANFRRMTLKPLFIIRGSDLLSMNDVLNEVPVTQRHDENAMRERQVVNRVSMNG